jgi:hypothetical protein
MSLHLVKDENENPISPMSDDNFCGTGATSILAETSASGSYHSATSEPPTPALANPTGSSTRPAGAPRESVVGKLEEGKEVVIEGWLKKKGRMSRMWKNRWFWLYDGKLFYDKQAHSTTARGYITVLDVLQVTAQTNVCPKPNVCRHRRRASSARPSRRLRADDRLRRS